LIEVLLELENFLQSDASPDEKKDQKILAAGQHLLYATGGIGEMLSDEDGNLINFEAHPCERTEGQIHVEFRAILIAREKKFYKYHFVHWLKAIVEAGLIDNGNAPIEIERAFVLRHYGLCNDSEAEIKMAEKIMADKLPSEIVKKWIN